jgi:hypothetical protein
MHSRPFTANASQAPVTTGDVAGPQAVRPRHASSPPIANRPDAATEIPQKLFLCNATEIFLFPKGPFHKDALMTSMLAPTRLRAFLHQDRAWPAGKPRPIALADHRT